LRRASANLPAVRTLIWAVRAVLELPLYLTARASPAWPAVQRDMRRCVQPRMDLGLPEHLTWHQTAQALRHRPLRSVLYARLRGEGLLWSLCGRALAVAYRGAVALEINCEQIGGGMSSFHGFATIIIARRIGQDFLFAQQVTVGYDDRGGTPIIGDRVRVGAGAIVIGPITIGDDAVVGAGAVVVKDVAPGTVVAGVPAAPIEHAADRFSARKAEPAE
jgi:serine O-acetyltransferase